MSRLTSLLTNKIGLEHEFLLILNYLLIYRENDFVLFYSVNITFSCTMYEAALVNHFSFCIGYASYTYNILQFPQYVDAENM